MSKNIHNILSMHNLLNGVISLFIGVAVFMALGFGMGIAIFSIAWTGAEAVMGLWGFSLPKNTQFFRLSLDLSAFIGALGMGCMALFNLWVFHYKKWENSPTTITTDLFFLPKPPSKEAALCVLKQSPKSLIVSIPVAVLSVALSIKINQTNWNHLNLALATCLATTFIIAFFVPRLQALRWALLVIPGLFVITAGYFLFDTDPVQNSLVYLLLLNVVFHNKDLQNSFNKGVYGAARDKNCLNIFAHIHEAISPEISSAFKAKTVDSHELYTLPGADRPLIISFDINPKKDWVDVLNTHSAKSPSLIVPKDENSLCRIIPKTNHEKLHLQAKIFELTGLKST